MKKILCLSFLVLSLGCNRCNDSRCYFNRSGKIVKIDDDCSQTSDKFHKPQLCHIALIQDLQDTLMFMELNSCDPPVGMNINNAWFYNHRIGDNVIFQYIHKDRYFLIRPR